MYSLSMIMDGTHGLISKAANDTAVSYDSEKVVDTYMVPGALWRKVEVQPASVILGEVLGKGAFSTVYKCVFKQKDAALKLFRNATEENAFKEIEITFALRHPNIIGLYAWVQRKVGTMTEIGMVLELGDRGDLMSFYNGKRLDTPYSFKLALKIVAGAATGLAYMHSMPCPIVHRDVKSANIMITSDGNTDQTGKIADCGESRRVELDSTMTQRGTPLWAAVRIRCKCSMHFETIDLLYLLTNKQTNKRSTSLSCLLVNVTMRTSTRTLSASCSLKSPRVDCRMRERGRPTKMLGARAST